MKQRETDEPEDLIRDQQFANSSSFSSLHDVRFTVPSSERILFEHFKEPVLGH